MSVVTLQLGQCGNQVGERLFQTLSNESLQGAPSGRYRNDIQTRFFRRAKSRKGQATGGLVARAVLVDMEPKVIHNVLAKAASSQSWAYDAKRTFTQQCGSANNWSYGYNLHGPKHGDAILDVVRSEVERCDRLSGFLLLQSLAGGTGSGVGTYVTELLADEFGPGFMVNQVVWPYESGEVIVQDFNSVLTLAKLTKESDGVVIFENDQLHTICSHLLNIKRVSFDDLNSLLARDLARVLLPSTEVEDPGTAMDSRVPTKSQQKPDSSQLHSKLTESRTRWIPLEQIVTHLFSNPKYKLSSVRAIPQVASSSKAFSSLSWSYLMKFLRQMQITGDFMEELIDWSVKLPSPTQGPKTSRRRPLSGASTSSGLPLVTLDTKINRCVASYLALRGEGCDSVSVDAFHDDGLYASWATNLEYPSGVRERIRPLQVGLSPASFHQDARSAAIWSVSQSVVKPLEKILKKSFEKFSSGAYLHHYTKQGTTQDEFSAAFAQLEQVCYDFKTL